MGTEYRYLLELDIPGSEAGHLIDALEDEPFPPRELLGEAELNRRIRDGELHFEHVSPERLGWFGEALATLSVYLSTYVTGLEIAEARDERGTRTHLEILKHAARKGERIAVPLTYQIAQPSGELEPGDEDLRHLNKVWSTLPRWAQDAYRLKFPELRRL
ncbi:MAG: hypothetical protein IPG45_09745 [Deltaproteobacteria bacterium]|nr:hypothetical protein [Deltaproteobacteria bacterium]